METFEELMNHLLRGKTEEQKLRFLENLMKYINEQNRNEKIKQLLKLK